MRIDRNEVKRIAGLARIELDDGAAELYCEQLGAILEYVARLDELSLDDTPPTFETLSEPPALRPDEPAGCLTQDEALANAPATEAGHFRVPRVFGDP